MKILARVYFALHRTVGLIVEHFRLHLSLLFDVSFITVLTNDDTKQTSQQIT